MASDSHPRRSALLGWVLFDWAAQPFFTLITTFIFAPYFANFIASTPVQGQSLWGYATAIAALIIALMAPILGNLADRYGSLKPWIFAFSIPLIFGSALLWFAMPGAQDHIILILMAYGLAMIGAEIASVFNNAMLAHLCPPSQYGKLSGSGWAAGYAGGLASLFIMLLFIIPDAQSGQTLIGLQSLFSFDADLHEGARFTGPFSALWYLIFALPLFIVTPDRPKQSIIVKEPILQIIGNAFMRFRHDLRQVTQHQSLWHYLLAHMLYADGLAALFTFGGIYAAGILGWGSMEIGIFAILILIAGIIGALLGGICDDAFGSKQVIVAALLLLITTSTVLAVTQSNRIFLFFPVADPVFDDALFTSPSEWVFLLCGVLIGLAAGPLQSASRHFMIRLAPRDKIGQFFGFFALSGKVTSFLGPLLVGLMTALFQDQRAGIIVVLMFLLSGLIVLRSVHNH